MTSLWLEKCIKTCRISRYKHDLPVYIICFVIRQLLLQLQPLASVSSEPIPYLDQHFETCDPLERKDEEGGEWEPLADGILFQPWQYPTETGVLLPGEERRITKALTANQTAKQTSSGWLISCMTTTTYMYIIDRLTRIFTGLTWHSYNTLSFTSWFLTGAG